MKIKYGFFLLTLILAVFTANLSAQSNKKDVDKYFDESGGFKHRLWYGGGFNLGYQGGSDYSIFNIGITPMIGYKIIPRVSFRPRLGIDYSYIKGEVLVLDNGQPVLVGRKSANLTSCSVGL